ncbi:hypothetical protein B0J11DRAFT_133339 [Dendryphion nanum]|uniref:Uncharacterized protein n=1 Tax=Dendryphion nanum TaxID=256645 RepID=A0A9P9D826_9PLEO|nr:hypothetical protein B0J11DRAFT_133339 [Dendryphion nanum]
MILLGVGIGIAILICWLWCRGHRWPNRNRGVGSRSYLLSNASPFAHNDQPSITTEGYMEKNQTSSTLACSTTMGKEYSNSRGTDQSNTLQRNQADTRADDNQTLSGSSLRHSTTSIRLSIETDYSIPEFTGVCP